MFPVVFISWAEFHSGLMQTLEKVSGVKSWIICRAKNAFPSAICFVKSEETNQPTSQKLCNIFSHVKQKHSELQENVFVLVEMWPDRKTGQKDFRMLGALHYGACLHEERDGDPNRLYPDKNTTKQFKASYFSGWDLFSWPLLGSFPADVHDALCS